MRLRWRQIAMRTYQVGLQSRDCKRLPEGGGLLQTAWLEGSQLAICFERACSRAHEPAGEQSEMSATAFCGLCSAQYDLCEAL